MSQPLEYKNLKSIVLDKNGEIVGRSEEITDHKGNRLILFRSVTCCGILPSSQNSNTCAKRLLIDSTLRIQLSRFRVLQSSGKRAEEVLNNRLKSNSTTNWRYLDIRQAQIRADEQRRRINAGKREEYAKRKFLEERKVRVLSQEWHDDLSHMYKDIDKGVNDKGPELTFPANPDASFFWKLQRDML